MGYRVCNAQVGGSVGKYVSLLNWETRLQILVNLLTYFPTDPATCALYIKQSIFIFVYLHNYKIFRTKIPKITLKKYKEVYTSLENLENNLYILE